MSFKFRQPWESFEEFEHKAKSMSIAQAEELRRTYRSFGIDPFMSGINRIGERIESHEVFLTRIDRERVKAELQRTKQNTKKLILLL